MLSISAARATVHKRYEANLAKWAMTMAPELVRMRVLDPSLLPISPADFSSPVAVPAPLTLGPQIVFVVENLESVLAMEAAPEAVVVHGSGYAVGKLREIP